MTPTMPKKAVYLEAYHDRLSIVDASVVVAATGRYEIERGLLDAVIRAKVELARAELVLLKSAEEDIEERADQERHGQRRSVAAQILAGHIRMLTEYVNRSDAASMMLASAQ